MLHGSSHPGVAGSELTRLLARFADAAPAAPKPAFAERLGQWLDWTGAISLAGALNAPVAAAQPARAGTADAAAADFRRVRAALEAAIAADADEDVSNPGDFAPHRRHCIGCQQQMQDAVAALRQRLRQQLGRRSAALARLAAIDAALDPALAARERTLLALVPLRLQAHFERLRRAAPEQPQWLATFRADRCNLLRAELAHRLLPAQGLLDTLLTDETR